MKKVIASVLFVLSIIIGAFTFSSSVSAMASIFMAPTKSATASTTVAFMAFGTATTTLTLPTPLALGMATKYDKALVMVQLSSTSSPGRVAIRAEHSLDGIDWFSYASKSPLALTAPTGTSTVVYADDVIYGFSTSSLYALGGVTSTSSRVAFYVETPTPYNRVVFYRPTTNAGEAATLGLWAAVQPIKEIQVINQ